MSDMLRITGMVSGMDTDATVKQLIQVEQIKIDRVEQEKQYLEWQKEDYKEVANLLRGFQDEYFDLLNPKTNMRSTSTFDMLSGTTMIGDAATSAISIKTGAESLVGDFTIDSVTQLATKDKYTSGDVGGTITTDDLTDMTAVISALGTSGTLSFTFDGTTKVIELDQTSGDLASFSADISAKLQDAFTNVDIKADIVGGTLEFNVYEKDDPALESGHSLTVGIHNNGLLTAMGLSSGDSNVIDIEDSLSDLFGNTVDSSFDINGTTFTFSSDTSISDIVTEVNESGAGVTMSYSTFSDTFTLESNTEGTDGIITMSDSVGTLLSDLKLTDGSETYDIALGSKFEINGVTTSRATNTFEFNGAEITINEIPTDVVKVGIETDTTEVKDLIVKFVDNYNEMISKINDMVSSKKNYDYDPLTVAQKKEMEEDDIDAWETQARKGTLSNDATLAKITRDLRTGLYESIEGLGVSLFDIGIQTSSNYKDQGKLIIDEDKLDATLAEKPNEIIELFTKQSDIGYTDSSSRGTRKSENGIAYRIYDILQDNIRITSDNSGNKGYLIEKAGNETGVDATSEMAKKILEMDNKIDDLLDMLGRQEEKYYTQFARMESAMSSLTAQGDWMASQLG